jgi:hypothetical protein
MLLGDIVGFKSELFFEGAVQLRWVEEKSEKASDAAEHFVFHGPHYHGVRQDDSEGISSAYKLKDTATLLSEFVESMAPGSRANNNPFSLVVAGYGSGKSHFALTLAKLLMAPSELLACKIVYNIRCADEEIGERVEGILDQLKKPSLVVTLDGMSNFHLGSELSRSVIKQLKAHDLDLGPILELSPRFTIAQDFVTRNFELRRDEFGKLLPGKNKERICTALQENDDDIYQAVDDIYYKANGTRIPVEGRESAQDLINTVCDSYCGDNGFFSNLIILFDEFGRYLEYAAEKPWLAGDSCLQQIFQGIQDNSGLARFVGFIQYELKAYLNRFSQKELSQLQRYITRFDSANKLYLSTNLETLFAHLIEKKNPSKLTALVEGEWNKESVRQTHSLLCDSLPGINNLPVWKDLRQFQQVIVKGCWPLHPLTTWFLTRQQDIVQSRSALTFIKDVLESTARKKAESDAGQLYTIPAAELVLHSMLEEIMAAERAQGGVIAETLFSLVEKYKARLSDAHRLALAGVMILDKLRISTKDKGQIDRLLLLCTGLSSRELDEGLRFLSAELGVVEWNRDLCQYELVADAATRGQFQQVLRRKLRSLDEGKLGELFASRARFFGEIGDIDPDFAGTKDVLSRDWQFSAIFAHCGNYLDAVSRAFEEWRSAEHHDDPKGRIIYLYVGSKEDPNSYLAKSKKLLKELLAKRGYSAAPILTVVIHDREGTIADNLGRLSVLEDFPDDELEKYRRFLPEEKERSSRVLREEIQVAVRQRLFAVAGMDEIAGQRLQLTAQWIFEQIYPQIFPFPFDGFQSKTGAGPKDCALVTKALIGRQVSGDWIATQPRQVQSRVTRLLVQVWKVMGREGKLLPRPGLEELAILLDLVESALKEKRATIYDVYLKLLEPPYGFNSSSAGLIIGLLLARETPPRALTYQNDNIAVQDWLALVYPGRTAKSFLDKNCLKSTRIVFLSEDSLQRWEKVLADLECEENLRKKVELFAAAESMKRTDQIPATLLGRFHFVAEKASEAKLLLAEHVKKVESIELALEKAVKKNDVNSLIHFGSDLKKHLKSMEEQESLWSADDFKEVRSVISEAVYALDGQVASWLELQICNNFAQISDFRFRMERTAKNLALLDLASEANLVDVHKNKIISQIDARMQYETSISSAVDCVRQPAPTKSTACWKLKEELKSCDKLMENLRVANAEIGGADITALIAEVQSRKLKLSSCIKQQKEELQALSISKPVTPQEVTALRNKLTEQVLLFRDTPDGDYVGDMMKQLDIILADLKGWSGLELSPEDSDRVLKERVAERCSQLKETVEEDMELNWDFFAVYSSYREFLVNERLQQSEKWFTAVKPEMANLASWSLQECKKQLSILSERPKYLSLQHAEEIDRIEKNIHRKAEDLKEREREREALKWMDGMRKEVEKKDTLTTEECERLLRALARIPDIVSEKEMHHVLALRKELTERQDALDIKSILERIRNLRDELRIELLNEIGKQYPILTTGI